MLTPGYWRSPKALPALISQWPQPDSALSRSLLMRCLCFNIKKIQKAPPFTPTITMHLKVKDQVKFCWQYSSKMGSEFVSYTEQTFPAFHTPDVPAAPEFTGSYHLYNHRIFKVGKKPQKDGVQPILHRYLNRDMYMNAWRQVKLFHFPCQVQDSKCEPGTRCFQRRR